MPNKKYFIILAVSLISVLSIVSFSYFVSNTRNGNNQKISIENGTMQLLYTDCTNTSDCSDITGELNPGDSISKTFSVKNTGTLDTSYKIVFSKSSNTFLDDELVYTLYNSDSNAKITEGIVPYGDNSNYYIYTESINAGETRNYKLDITFKNIKTGNNESNSNSDFNIKLGIGENNVWTFKYTGEVQTFTASKDGLYQLEVWGSEGSSWGGDHHNYTVGGYGGYSKGIVRLSSDEKIYLSIGGRPWNGGGLSSVSANIPIGGGATSIQLSLINDGQLKNYESNKEEILVVAGGGAGSEWELSSSSSLPSGGSGGGYKGNNGLPGWRFPRYGYGGTQTEGGHSLTFDEYSASGKAAKTVYDGSFGQGGHTEDGDGGGQGGGGFYGGGASNYAGGGGGGSGYIGNSLLTDKHMTCYNCETSDEISTKTISVTCANEAPTEDCAKEGTGYTRITYLGEK